MINTMLQELQLIKENLFGAPVEIKQSFNDIVQYFDKSRKYWMVEVNELPLNKDKTTKVKSIFSIESNQSSKEGAATAHYLKFKYGHPKVLDYKIFETYKEAKSYYDSLKELSTDEYKKLINK